MTSSSSSYVTVKLWPNRHIKRCVACVNTEIVDIFGISHKYKQRHAGPFANVLSGRSAKYRPLPRQALMLPWREYIRVMAQQYVSAYHHETEQPFVGTFSKVTLGRRLPLCPPVPSASPLRRVSRRIFSRDTALLSLRGGCRSP